MLKLNNVVEYSLPDEIISNYDLPYIKKISDMYKN